MSIMLLNFRLVEEKTILARFVIKSEIQNFFKIIRKSNRWTDKKVFEEFIVANENKKNIIFKNIGLRYTSY